jgi:hypothetical protein
MPSAIKGISWRRKELVPALIRFMLLEENK